MDRQMLLSYLNAVAPYMLVASISTAIAISEIVTVFENDASRALKTWGSFLLIFLNVAFSILLLMMVNSVGNYGVSNRFWIALGVGLGFSTLLRTKFTFIKPLPGSADEGVAVSLDELYGRLQRFCRRQIDQRLATDRVQTVDEAMAQLDLAVLEQRLRLLLEGGLILADPNAAKYVDRILEQTTYTESRKKMLLAFGLLNYGGFNTLKKLLVVSKRQSKP